MLRLLEYSVPHLAAAGLAGDGSQQALSWLILYLGVIDFGDIVVAGMQLQR